MTLLLTAGLISLAGATSVADAAPVAKRAPASAFVRAAHLSPDTAAVDVYLTAGNGASTALWLSGVGYGQVSTYRRLAPGTYTVAMRPAGSSAGSGAAVSWRMVLKAGHAYTAAAIGTSGHLRGIVDDDRLSAPKAGTGLIRVMQASSRAGRVSVATGGSTLVSAVSFGTTTGYVSVPAGPWTLRLASAGHPALDTRVHVTVDSQSVSSLVVLDAPGGGLTVHALLDAAGAPTAPGGAVSAGGGGTAPRPASRPLLADVLVGAGGLLGLVALVALAARAARWRRPVAVGS